MLIILEVCLCSTKNEFLILWGNGWENQPNKNPIVLKINAIGFKMEVGGESQPPFINGYKSAI